MMRSKPKRKSELDIVIIGCGINGLFSAYNLLKEGHSVTIIDRNREGLTSKNNAGLLQPSSLTSSPTMSPGRAFQAATVGWGAVYISPSQVARNMKWFMSAFGNMTGYEEKVRELGMLSLKLYLDFFEKEHINPDVQTGIAALYSNEDDGRKAAAAGKGRFIDEAEISQLGYMNLKGGAMFENEVSINPIKLYESLRSRVSEMGANLILGKEAKLKTSGRKVEYVDIGEKVRADKYLVTTGSWADQTLKLLGYKPHVMPARGMIMLFSTGMAKVVNAPAILEDTGIAIIQHNPNTLRITGFYEMVGHSPEFKESRKKWLLDNVKMHMKNFGKVSFVRQSYGFRPCTSDQLPVIGKVPGYSDLFVAVGQCRLGMTLAAASGYAISEIIQGRKPSGVNADNFSPERFAL